MEKTCRVYYSQTETTFLTCGGGRGLKEPDQSNPHHRGTLQITLPPNHFKRNVMD